MNTSKSVEIEDEQIADEAVIVNDEQQEVEEQAVESTDTAAAEADPDEVIVTIGDEKPPEEEAEARAPEWVRELRKAHRELQRENRELKAKAVVVTEAKAIGKKPALEDFDYDADKFEAALTDWHDRKREADAKAAKAEEDAAAQNRAWQAKLDDYATSKTALKVRDYEEAEAIVMETLSQTQQGVILQGAENPAVVIYALGKNAGKAKELASIKDPVKFSFAIAKLETQLKVTTRKAPPAPEKTVTGTGRVSGSVDSTLDRLRDEAAKTGDFTKVLQYKAQQKAKKK